MSKRKHKMPMWGKNVIHAVKVGLKASTHVFTIGGIVVATSPLHRGLGQVVHGDFEGAAVSIKQDTIAAGSGTPTLQQAATQAAVGVVLPLAIGVGLIWGGGYLRKRIGN
jgi:hypothetical protein